MNRLVRALRMVWHFVSDYHTFITALFVMRLSNCWPRDSLGMNSAMRFLYWYALMCPPLKRWGSLTTSFFSMWRIVCFWELVSKQFPSFLVWFHVEQPWFLVKRSKHVLGFVTFVTSLMPLSACKRMWWCLWTKLPMLCTTKWSCIKGSQTRILVMPFLLWKKPAADNTNKVQNMSLNYNTQNC